MKTTANLTSLLAAASLVGAIGLAYAQTAPTPNEITPPGPDAQSQMNNNAPGTPDTSSQAPAPSTPMGAQPDLAPQADRN